MTIFGASSLHPKIPFPAAVVECEVRPRLQPLFGILDPRYSYSGLSPSASNCRLHSVGGSRRRSIPTPRGRRPSTAALTRLGARKASEMVMLTCRALHFSRAQSSATVVNRPETTSSSHRRPRAMALTRRAAVRTVLGGFRFEGYYAEAGSGEISWMVVSAREL